MTGQIIKLDGGRSLTSAGKGSYFDIISYNDLNKYYSKY